MMRIGARDYGRKQAKAVAADSLGNLGTYTIGTTSTIGNFKGKKAGDLSVPHTMSRASTNVLLQPQSSSFQEVPQMLYDGIGNEVTGTTNSQTSQVGNFMQVLFKFDVFELVARKNKSVSGSMSANDYRDLFRTLRPRLIAYGQGAGSGAFKYEIKLHIWNRIDNKWEIIDQGTTNDYQELSATLSGDMSRYLTGDSPGKYIYLSTSVPVADSERASYTRISYIDLEVEFRGEVDVLSSIGRKNDKAITDTDSSATQISLLKGIIKQLQEGTDADFDIGKGFDEATDSFKSKIVNAIEVLEPHAFQMTDELLALSNRTTSPDTIYKTPPKGAKGVMVEAYVESVSSGNLSLNIGGYILNDSKLGIELNTEQVTGNDKKIVIIWHPDAKKGESLGDDLYVISLPLTPKIVINNVVSGNVKSDLNLVWLT